MNLRRRILAALLCLGAAGPGLCPRSFAQDPETANPLSLADLAGYRVALAGEPTDRSASADEPPARVGFRDLWDRPEQLRGRRVTVQGRIARIFRQGAVGSFPPLAEIWIT